MGNIDGDADEKPLHKVKLTSFYIDKYEVTNRQYARFLNANGNQTEDDALWIEIEDEDCGISYRNGRYRAKKGMPDIPVVEVSWYGARAYAKWIGKRLPTEAEWEYAANGGVNSANYHYSGGNTIDEIAWYSKNANDKPQAIGLKKPNELGVYDMSGNVFEWCSDWYGMDYYKNSTLENPVGPKWADYKVIRGGGWATIAKDTRKTYRDYNPVNAYNFAVGFRCVKSVKKQD